jgi:hypothetical protein
LEGKTGQEIVDRMTLKFASQYSKEDVKDDLDDDYILHLEGLVLLAVEHALLNCEEVKELIQEGEYQAQQRAIAFLNTVLPKA